uniref:Uncharacterized protein n=1 Tax=Mycena chlorophos TaxID=658473 RepID=A0ABQ0KXS3_MYCCL|nr:predicted protein [Mycena chlorophos]
MVAVAKDSAKGGSRAVPWTIPSSRIFLGCVVVGIKVWDLRSDHRGSRAGSFFPSASAALAAMRTTTIIELVNPTMASIRLAKLSNPSGNDYVECSIRPNLRVHATSSECIILETHLPSPGN